MHLASSGGEDGSARKAAGNNLESGGNHQNNHQNFSGVTVRITLLLAVVGITCLFLFRSSFPFVFFRESSLFSQPNDSKTSSSPSCQSYAAQNNTPNSPSNQYASQNLLFSAKEDMNNNNNNEELEKMLRKAVMSDNRTVIITTLNAAWAQPNCTFDLFLESFRIGNGTADLLKHLVVGAFDQAAYNRCLAEGLHCFTIITDGVDFSVEEVFMQGAYLKMMWRRLVDLTTILELGFDFIFTDTDVMWLRDPFERLYSDGDIQIACDHYETNPTNLNNAANGGFFYVKSNNRTIQFYKYWYGGWEYFPGKNEQDVFNIIKYYPLIPKIGLEIRFLDTAYFGGFCEPIQDLDVVITMHATCCVGQVDKMNALKMEKICLLPT